MLVYVFWHWPRPDVSPQEYERALRLFHRELRDAPPAGMQRSLAWRVDGASWLPAGPAYEDWYLLDDAGALDTVAREAVSGAVGTRHDVAARLSAGGTAGLYRPARAPEGDVRGSRAFWFGKPPEMSYGDLFAQAPGPAETLWMRMLVLGPTPEFCLLGTEETELPEGWDVVTVRRRAVWP